MKPIRFTSPSGCTSIDATFLSSVYSARQCGKHHHTDKRTHPSVDRHSNETADAFLFSVGSPRTENAEMKRETPTSQRVHKNTWKMRVSLVIGGFAILAASLAIRSLTSTDPVVAQGRQNAPSRTRRTAASPSQSVPAKTAAPARVGNIAATVNSQTITRQQLANECLRRYGPEVLEELINKHVLLQACQQRNLIITEKQVDAAITRFAARFGLPTSQWLNVMKERRNMTPDQYRRDVIWPMLALKALAAKRVVVTPQDLQRALESEFGPKVKARVITVGTKTKATQVHQQVTSKPEDFGRLARQFSDDPSGSSQGVIPAIRKHVGNPELERVAFSLRETEISPVFKVGDKYVILICDQHIPRSSVFSNAQMLETEKARLREQIAEDKLRVAASDVYKQLQNEANVVNLLKKTELQQQYPGIAAHINSGKITFRQLAEKCLSRYGNEVLEGEVNRLILTQALSQRKQAIQQTDIDREITRAADAYGYWKEDGTPDVDRWLQKVTEAAGASVELYIRDAVWPSVALKKMVENTIEVTPDDMQRSIESNYGERVRVMAIVVNDQRLAQRLRTQAHENPTAEYFSELAHQFSTEPVSKENHGTVPPIRKHSGQPLVEREAFSLTEQDPLSSIIVVADKFILLRYLGRTVPQVEQVDAEVRRELANHIHEKKLRLKMELEFERLRKSARVENYLAAATPGKSPGRPRTAQTLRPGQTRQR